MSEPVDMKVYERLVKESMGRKAQVRTLKAKVAELEGRIAEADSLRRENEGLKARLADRTPDELQARVDELERAALVRERTEAFHDLVGKAGVPKEGFGDVERFLGWKPDADDYDPSGHEAAIAELTARIPGLKDRRHSPADRDPRPAGPGRQGFETGRPAGPASDRGAAPPRDDAPTAPSRGRRPGQLA